jgi:lipid-binding SYLF domain-containing protein
MSVAMLAAACGAISLAGCNPKPANQSEQATLTGDSHASLDAFVNADSSLRDMLNRSAGYAIFPDVGKAGFIAGGAYGRGEVYQHGHLVGYADMTQGSVGLQIGAQTYDELIVFQSDDTLNQFKGGNFSFSGNLSAVAIKPGAAADTTFQNGVAVFVQPKGGAMAEASIGGQKFDFRPL